VRRHTRYFAPQSEKEESDYGALLAQPFDLQLSPSLVSLNDMALFFLSKRPMVIA
jgi:hypothetical protein